MIQTLQRNLVLVAGIVLVGIVCLMAAPYLISSRGDTGPTIVQSQSQIAAIIAILMSLSAATVIAAGVAKFINAAVALFVLGAGLFVLDGRLDTVREFAMANAGVNPRMPLALLATEALVWSGLVLAATSVVFAIGGPLQDIEPDVRGIRPHPLTSRAAWKSASAGLLMLPAVFLVAQSPMKGQMIGTTFIGGVLAGLGSRLISPHVQPILVYSTTVLAGGIGYVIAMFMIKLPLDAAFVADELPAFARVMPLDYAAGALMGVSFGLGWAKSFLQPEEQPANAPVVATHG